MIINLTQSKLFTHHPDSRFSKEYAVPRGTWDELWRRYSLKNYTNKDIRDFLFIKYARRPSYDSIERWIWRTKIYIYVRPAMKKGVKFVVSDFFKDYEQSIIDELTKQLRYGATTDSRSII